MPKRYLCHPAFVGEIDVSEEKLLSQPCLLDNFYVVAFVKALHCVTKVTHYIWLFQHLVHTIKEICIINPPQLLVFISPKWANQDVSYPNHFPPTNYV